MYFNDEKKDLDIILKSIPDYEINKNIDLDKNNNILIQGDNLQSLKSLIFDFNLKNKIDLVYIDPPFSTNNNFTITNGRANTISNSKKGDLAYSDTLRGLNFLDYIRDRLKLLKELLSEKGSIYLHIDYKIGHYIKIIMDEVFGIDNFRNDITRIKTNPKNFKRIGYGNIKDLILFYTKSSSPIWNEPHLKYTENDMKKLFPKIDKNGNRYTTVPIHAPGETQNGNSSKPFKGILPPPGRHWRTDIGIMNQWDDEGLIEWSNTGNPRKKIFLQDREGKRVQDIWDFKDPQYPVYPTEKNLNMLELIIKTSSEQNSYVLDCFCGSGTTLKAAQLNNRKWIGIDKSNLAIKAAAKKLNKIENSLFNYNNNYDIYEISPTPSLMV